MFQEIAEKVYQYDTNIKGPNVLVQCGVHGNEISGIYAADKLRNDIESGILEILKGKLTVIYANPQAILQNTRSVNVNMNRHFGLDFGQFLGFEFNPKLLYEINRFLTIEPFYKNLDYFIDLHSTSCVKDPFIFCRSQDNDFVKDFNALYVVNDLSTFNSFEGVSHNLAFLNGAKAFTFEAGIHTDPQTVDVSFEAIIRLLSKAQMIENKFESTDKPKFLTVERILTKKTDDDFWCQQFTDFTYLKEGTALFQSGSEPISMPYDGYLVLPTPMDIVKPFEEVAFLATEN